MSAKALLQKWQPVLEAADAGDIGDYNRRVVTAQLLENQERDNEVQMGSAVSMLSETVNANSVTNNGIANWNPILISLVRRAMPNLLAHDIASVQPMSGPTGLIFALKSRYTTMNGTEALFDEADTDFSGAGTHVGDPSSLPTGVGDLEATAGDAGAAGSGGSGTGVGAGDAILDPFGVGTGMTTTAAEILGDTGTEFNEMAMSIESATVTANSRALKARYTVEVAQDMKAIHNLDAEAELANIISTEILAEMNRELVRTINVKAKLGAKQANTTNNGIFNLSTDADGRWSVEKFKGLVVQLDLEANAIAKDTRRGRGNFIICSSDVATALSSADILDYTPALASKLSVDDTGNLFAGTINGRIKVYIDPYAVTNYVTVGFRGSNSFDAGMFFAPYVPLTMYRAQDPETFQPMIGFKTRYGLVANPFAESAPVNGTGSNRSNSYYRIFRVDGILQ